MESIKIYNSVLERYEWKNSLGQLHKEDGPAVEYDNGNKIWYQNGELHREDGPAFEFDDRIKFWYYRGKHIPCKSRQEFEKLIKLQAFL